MTSGTKTNGQLGELELLGIGAAKDRELKSNLKSAMEALDIKVPVQEVTQITRMLEYGISGIPALRINGHLAAQKRVPSVDELRLLLGFTLLPPSTDHPIRHIVVPTDFSSTARNAYQYAVRLAKALGAKIKLVHIHQPKVDMTGGVVVDAPNSLQLKKEMLEEMAVGSRGEGGVKVIGRNAEAVDCEVITGGVAEELKNLSRDPATDLMVMGMTGESGFLDKLLGRISAEVAKRAHCPVVLVPEGARYHPISDVVYATNFAAKEDRLAGEVLRFTQLVASRLHLLHVEQARSDEYFMERAPLYRPGGKTKVTEYVRISGKDVPSILNDYVTEVGGDLLVMFTQRRSLVESLFHRSMTRRMAYHTNVPLMIRHLD